MDLQITQTRHPKSVADRRVDSRSGPTRPAFRTQWYLLSLVHPSQQGASRSLDRKRACVVRLQGSNFFEETRGLEPAHALRRDVSLLTTVSDRLEHANGVRRSMLKRISL